MAKKQNPAVTKLKIFQTLKESLVFYKQNWWLLIKVTFIVALPVGLLQLIQTDAFNGDSTVIASIAWIFALMAILYVALTPELPSKKIRDIYTKVSGRFLQYTLATLILVVFSLPLIGALQIILFILFEGAGAVWYGLLALVLIGLSVYLYSRFILALPAVIDKPITSFAGLGLAGRLSRKNRIRTMVTLGLLLLAILVLLTLVSMMVGLSEALNQNKYFSSFVYVVEATIFTPIIIVTIAKCYKKLS